MLKVLYDGTNNVIKGERIYEKERNFRRCSPLFRKECL